MNLVYKKVIELDKHTCQFFGCNCRDIQVHHIIPKSYKIINKEWNLVCLCAKHHDLVTENKITNIEFLTKIKNNPNFRWQKALEWHLERQILKQLRGANGKN